MRRLSFIRRGAVKFLTGLLLAAALAAPAATSQAAELKKVRIGVATTFLGITYPWLMMPQALGYWKDEGYDVEVLPIGGSLQVVQQMVGGGVDIGQVNSSVIIQANVVNGIPVRAFMTNGVIDWSVAVPSDSDIKTATDLKGKKIGVFSLASGGIPFLKSYLAKSGVSPDNDVQLIAVGLGAPAVQALKSKQVDALMFWAPANAGFENAGLSLRYIRDPAWLTLPDFSMTALDKTIKQDPKMIEAIARGAAKATVFAMANPDCVRKIQWMRWPDSKPTGADPEILAKHDLNTLNAQLDTMKVTLALSPSGLWGQTSSDAYARLQTFMTQVGLIGKSAPAGNFLVEDEGFFKRVNDFDHDAIVASAKACDLK
jgi:NitT/TauT family transport system substrate-binding protein